MVAQQSEQLLDEVKLEEFAERVATDQNAGVAGVLVYIGDRLGLWASLADSGPVSPDELAEAIGLDPSYLAEWLAAQASAEYLVYDPNTGQFSLPAEHAAVLADETSPAALAGGFEFQAGCWADADRVAGLFLTGEGLGWGERDPRLPNGVARFFRPLYESSLVSQWLPALEGVTAKLEDGGRVLDVGCGQGLSTILLAQSFPNSTLVGIDPDEASLAKARQASREAEVDERVTFQVATADEDVGGQWDLICFFDAFHHLGDPATAARRVRDSLADDGTLMLVEPLAKDRIEDNLVMAGPLYYSPSTMVCLPDALAQPGGVALGAQAGPKRILQILNEAGLTTARVAAETDFNIVIEARL